MLKTALFSVSSDEEFKDLDYRKLNENFVIKNSKVENLEQYYECMIQLQKITNREQQ